MCFSDLSSETAPAPSDARGTTEAGNVHLGSTNTYTHTKIHAQSDTDPKPPPQHRGLPLQVPTSRNASAEEKEAANSHVFLTQSFLSCFQQFLPSPATGKG